MTKTTKPVIPPTIGRRVLVFAPTLKGVHVNNPSVPFDGGIAYVHSDAMLNVGYVDHNGVAHNQTSVKLLDRAQTADDAHGKEWYAVWMEYQFNQALRTQDRANLTEQQPTHFPRRPPDVELKKISDGPAVPAEEA